MEWQPSISWESEWQKWKIEYSDEYRFLEDERVYLIKLYAHGFALDNNAFQVLDIKDLQPLRFKIVSETEKQRQMMQHWPI